MKICSIVHVLPDKKPERRPRTNSNLYKLLKPSRFFKPWHSKKISKALDLSDCLALYEANDCVSLPLCWTEDLSTYSESLSTKLFSEISFFLFVCIDLILKGGFSWSHQSSPLFIIMLLLFPPSLSCVLLSCIVSFWSRVLSTLCPVYVQFVWLYQNPLPALQVRGSSNNLVTI